MRLPLAPLLLICCLALPLAAAGRDPMSEPRFVTASGTAGIVDGIVTALAQDEGGLIWVGTSVGLVRYDGYQTKTYPMTDDARPGSRANRFLRALLADRGGVLWAGSASEGLARFDSQAERWTYLQHDPAVPHSISPGSVQRLARAHDGRIWVGLLAGLDRLDPTTGRFEHFRAGAGSGLPDNHIGALLVDRDGDLWAGTWHGLARLRAGAQRFEPVAGDWAVNALAQGSDGRIWVGTRDGRLLLLDRDGHAAPQALAAGDGARPSPVLSLLSVGEGEVWVGRVTGVELRATDGRLLQLLKRNQRRPWTLGGTDFHALLRDRAGTLWVGGYGGGLQRYDPENQALWVRRQDDDPASPLADTDVRSVLQLGNGEIWLGTLERGIAVLDPQLRLTAAIRPDAHFNGLVAALAQARDGSVWAGTESGELYHFDAQRRLREVRSTAQARVRRLLAGRDGTLWVGTADGLHRLAPGAAELDRLPLAGGRRLDGNVNALVETADGQLWVGAEAGLFRLADGALQPAGAGLPQESVLGLLMDRHGTLWADTSAGLFRRQPGGAFERVGLHRGGAQDRSFGANLLADGQGRIWTHRGMFDPAAGLYTEFGRIDGVDIGTGWFRAYGQLADGRMLFGGSTGLLVAEPRHFSRWDFQPPIVVTELRIDSRRQPLGLLREGLTLTSQQRAFSVEFASLDYSAPAQNLYRYRLLGYDDDWITTGAELRLASYANLSPGRYTLQVQGSNRLGDWTDRPLLIDVEVQPAWWQTWWARLLGGLLAVLGVYGLVQWRTRALERRQAELERRVQERTAELEALSEALKESSLSDPLTGLHNRRYLTQHIDADIAVALRRHAADGAPSDNGDLVFMLVDVDHFKLVNDRHGHSAGDAVLVQMRERLREVCRDSDHVVRWGGEEFLVVARDGSREHAADLAERMRRAVCGRPFELPDGQTLTRSCSIGFACFPLSAAHPQALDWSTLIDVADGALYEAKRAGRDRWVGVISADPGLDVDALRELLSRPPAEWLASERLRVLRSAG
ncbi:two-component regulator propeller domain-containing protein [Roseateles sp. DXS20W]|uniref:diguanylate cyclase n=1 Tax=Pelomonas lactea TaxID=3299030 RepID=A0ABW7GET6_9BURK